MPDFAGLPRIDDLQISEALKIELTSKGFELIEVEHQEGFPSIQYMRKGNILVCISVPSCHADHYRLTYEDVITAKERIAGNPSQHFIIPVLGEGATELHFTTIYQEVPKKPLMVDSKLGSPEIFFSARPSILRKLVNVFKGMWLAASASLVQRSALIPSHHTPEVGYLGLGTQSFLDGYSCGFHTIAHTLAIVDLIERNKAITQENLQGYLHKNNPIQAAIALLKKNRETAYRSATGWDSFVITALRKTFFDGKQLPKQFLFSDWPQQGSRRAKTGYVISYPFKAVVNLVKLFTEFPLTLLTESLQYLITRLMIRGTHDQEIPVNPRQQTLRTFWLGLAYLAYGLASIPRALVRMVTSPINSYRDAKVIHPALGYLSALGSIVAYSAIILFTLPIGLPLTITQGVAFVAKSMGLGIATDAASTSLITVSFINFSLWAMLNKTVDLLQRSSLFRTSKRKPVAKVPALDETHSSDSQKATSPKKESSSSHDKMLKLGLVPHDDLADDVLFSTPVKLVLPEAAAASKKQEIFSDDPPSTKMPLDTSDIFTM